MATILSYPSQIPAKCLPIAAEGDVIEARKAARALAAYLGFSEADQVTIVAAVSEAVRNIMGNGQSGVITVSIVQNSIRTGLQIVALDDGPGIADIDEVIQDKYWYSQYHRLGLGLFTARHLVDEFYVESKIGEGTKITMKKWLP